MKKIIFGMLILIAACSDDESSDTKCHTAKNSAGDRVFLRCTTKDIYNQGEHEFPNWDLYVDHKLEDCDNCK